MRQIGLSVLSALFCVLALLSVAEPAMAYTGPGAGITALGSLLALISTLALVIVGFVWYPVKRLLAVKRRKAPTETKPT